MKSVEKISEVLYRIDTERKNSTKGIFLNSAGSSFFMINGEMTVPRISVKQLDYDTALPVMIEASSFIPEYLAGHELLEKRNPPSDEHHVHLARRIPGRVIDFVHMLKLDLKFPGNVLKIIQKSDTDFYPSYITDKIFFRSQLVPVFKNSTIHEMAQVRLIESRHIESDQHFHTFAIFDDIKEKDISKELSKIPGPNLFKISVELYQFIAYGYFTSCLNIPNPSDAELLFASEIYEPLFMFIFSKYKKLTELADEKTLSGYFSESLLLEERISLKEEYMARLGEFFGRYALFTDDELMLKGWRKFIIS